MYVPTSQLYNKSMKQKKADSTEDFIEKKFAERLLELRTEKGWTQAKVAQCIGVSAISYLHYEKGQRIPSLGTIVKIAQLYDVSTDYLFGIAVY